MPCIKPLKIDRSSPVLLSGADGFVGGVLTKRLLEEGLTVHATVFPGAMKSGRLEHLIEMEKRVQKELGEAKAGKIRFFEANLLNDGDFAEAMKGCSVVFHLASPFILSDQIDPWKHLVHPAIQGTKNVLGQACQTPSVKVVVMTSSVGAVYCDNADSEEAPGGVLTEDVWNRNSTLDHQEYYLSKTLAEQAAWVIAGSQTQWKLVTINPGLIWGPGIKCFPESESFRFMRRLGGALDPIVLAAGIPDFGISVADVRDVADAHLAAAYLPESAGRHIFCGAVTSLIDLGTILRKQFPDYPTVDDKAEVPTFLMWLLGPYTSDMGTTRKFAVRNYRNKPILDNSKSKKELGIDYIPLAVTCRDMYQQMIDAGVVVPTSQLPGYSWGGRMGVRLYALLLGIMVVLTQMFPFIFKKKPPVQQIHAKEDADEKKKA